MRNRFDEAKSELLTKAAALADRNHRGEDEAFLRRYYRHAAPEDLVDRDIGDVFGLAASHRAMAQERPQGTAIVRIYTPTVDEEGWTSHHTVIELVTDDMPFIVDSVNMALADHDYPIRSLLHPQMIVRRDITGRMIEVCDFDINDPKLEETQDAVVESWIHIEIDRVHDASERAEVEKILRKVLSDVREAVEDWPRMRQRAVEIAEEIKDQRLPLPAREVEEAEELLRWLADEHFTFLGYREYLLDEIDGEDVLRAQTGSGLGFLRADEDVASSFAKLPPAVRTKAREKRLLVLTKANSKSTVHRRAYLDYVGVKMFDDAGEVIGERRFLGLLTSSAYTESVLRIPILRQKVKSVIQQSGMSLSSHSGKDLLQVLETFPRDELFQTPVDDLLTIALTVVHLEERRQLRMFVRRDDYGRYLSILLYLPRDRYDSDVRKRFEEILLSASGGESIDFTARIGESALARVHFVIRAYPEQGLPEIDIPSLEKQLAIATRSWIDELSDALVEQVGEEATARLLRRYKNGFPEGYKELFPARTAVADIRRLEELPASDGLAMNLYQPIGGHVNDRRFKLYRTGSPISLMRILPILSRMGVEVVDERPYEIVCDTPEGQTSAYIYDFGLRYDGAADADPETLKGLFQDTFAAVWRGDAESDSFNALVPRAGLSWRQVTILRGYAKYMRQAGSTFSQNYLEQALSSYVNIARMLVDLFEVRFAPERFADDKKGRTARSAAIEKAVADVESALEDVTSLDQDRILRSFLGLITATLRTNFYRVNDDGSHRSAISYKLDARSIPDLPEPKPQFEVWVYSPRVEGVHLRYGPVARGGLRWSDRREDFRTEILGLLKAQVAKNAVIVPVGAKGGFVGKQLPDPTIDRDAWLAEGIECYKTFIRAMLDITDNRDVDRSVIAPPQVVRHDGDDPYLVVAADKGTASFSDIANEVSKEYDFWLDDAFASGGSAGYDHKAMGITARGAWESVKRHFREMGRDCQNEDFTAVGIGDMSGDVFGNGMLLSQHIRLIGAFDHRHIFLDPTPDAATSYKERKRLFGLSRSTWDDYDRDLLSEGGGVYPRTQKKIRLTPEVKQRLGIPASVKTMSPPELIRALLTAPVDLLWNGGIGTYVKAASETNVDVGDKTNDTVRVNGEDLRCAIVGEGGNLGLTQAGRVEFARAGGRINTDAIDNCAGVDTSDSEVNIKILLDNAVRAGDLTEKRRNTLLAKMTDEVADLVLDNNYQQNLVLAKAVFQASNLAHVHRSYISSLEAAGVLDRDLEALPTDRQLAERISVGQGLTSPELSVLLAYTKNTMYTKLLDSSVPDDPYLTGALHAYFPSAVREKFATYIDKHPLRREIITNVVMNELVNEAGTTFAYRLAMETGGTTEDLARAHIVASEVYKLREFQSVISELDNVVPNDVQMRMRLAGRTITERATRWLVVNRRPPIDISRQISYFTEPIQQLLVELPNLLIGRELALYEDRLDSLVQARVPENLAVRVAVLPPAYAGLGIVENSQATKTDVLEVARVHFTLGEHLDLGRLLERIVALPRNNRWNTMARAALRDELHALQAGLTAQVIQHTSEGDDPAKRVQAWESQDPIMVDRARRTLGEIVDGESFDLARLSVGLRLVRSLLRLEHE